MGGYTSQSWGLGRIGLRSSRKGGWVNGSYSYSLPPRKRRPKNPVNVGKIYNVSPTAWPGGCTRIFLDQEVYVWLLSQISYTSTGPRWRRPSYHEKGTRLKEVSRRWKR